jgi:site-specific DNA recombinase
MMRAAIYARYSSDNQRDTSIDDQIRECNKRIAQDGWTLSEVYSDHAVSGASLLRSGYQKMMEDARNGAFDILVAEAMDRLSRDQEDIAGLYKQLSFADVRIVTLSEGEINELHVGLKGTMNALFLKDLALKTHRGLEGRVLDGKSGGGRSYGYEVAKIHDEHGDRVRGNLVINDEEVKTVLRIFDEYIKGTSPRAIAIKLNQQGIPAPSGKGWSHSTIIGNRKRGTGILNNQLYVGKRIWNRLCYRKDPISRKRVSRLNPENEWIIVDVPDLRIIGDNTWRQAQALQESRTRDTRPDTNRSPDWRHRRAKHLLSGLIKCAECGGGMSLVSKVYYGCSARRNKGTCTNSLTIRLDRLEESVLRGLQERLVTPELTKVFVKEYTKEVNRIRAESAVSHDGTQKRVTLLNGQIDNIVEAIAIGQSSPALHARLEGLEKEKYNLERDLSMTIPDPVRIHPNVADIYVSKINNLRQALNDDNTRLEAVQILRTLIDEIRLHPIDGALQIELKGDLATLLGYADTAQKEKKMPGSHGDPGSTEWLVAGARNNQDSTLTKFI